MKLKRLVAGTALALATGSLALPMASADQGLGFSVAPAPRPGSPDGPRDYLRLAAAAGGTATDTLLVRNLSGAPMEVRVAGVDAATGPLGGASYAPAASPARAVGSWISVSRRVLTLGPNASETVDVNVRVPPDARSGQHLGAVTVSTSAASPTISVPSKGLDAGISLATRRVVAVQVAVPGPSEPELVVTGVAPAGRPSGLFLLVDLANQGSDLTTAEGTIDVPSLGFHRTFNVDTFVPGTSIRYPVEWGGDVPAGRFDARVELRYGSRVARWAGAIVIGDRVADELDRRQVSTQPARTSPRGSSLPWALLVGAVGLGAATGFLVRRRPRTAGTGAGSE